jgi:hypothetical protein
MNRIHLAALAVAALALPTSITSAQFVTPGTAGGTPDRGTEGRVFEDRDVKTCLGVPGGSRVVRSDCDRETQTEIVSREQTTELLFKLNAPPLATQCSATTTTKYEQRNTVARINTRFEIADCTLASGAFTVAVRVKDENGEEKPPLEFSETWQRSDPNDFQFAADYPIGENVDLISVRQRGFTCTCGEAAPEVHSLAEDVTPAGPP